MQASLSNIPPKSALLVVHVISAWVMSLFTWWVSATNHLLATVMKALVTQDRIPQMLGGTLE